ncbi:uncharacterized protein LOC135812570 [Sycon ciliatum]|uniref:uncharacterized protein LOC135812570 n=1 Tax=Sycon ciliatum TaxID=27933 RepID=UPI0031F670F9
MEAAAAAAMLSDYISMSDYTSAFPQEMGGFDENVFTTPVDQHYQCSICQMVLRNPMLVVACGHQFCHQCIVKALERSEICPLDRKPVSLQAPGALVPNRGTKRIVGRFEVFCEKRERGCTWTGTLNSYDSHTGVCPKVIVKCPFQYAGTGCDYECMREDVGEHCWQQSQEHNNMMVQRMDVLTNSIWQVATRPAEHRRTVHTEVFGQIADRLRGGHTFYGEAFYSGPCDSGYRLRMKIVPNQRKLGLYYSLVKGKNDELLDWPFRHTVIFQCLHITEDRVIVQRTVPPPRDEDEAWSRPSTGQPSDTNHGWGFQDILSRSKLKHAGVRRSDRVRIRYIVLWELCPAPGAA